MQRQPANLAALAVPLAGADCPPPPWVSALFAGVEVGTTTLADRRVTTQTADHFSLTTVRVADVDAMDPAGVERATAAAYDAIAERLNGLAAHHPVRFWNHIPSIHHDGGRDEVTGKTLDRYMVFNAGRYTACSRWLGGESAFARLLATASGVGHGGSDLVIHALAADRPGVAVENPRQVPAYRYSARYGPRPPCFARATLIEAAGPLAERAVLVGGTASVRGEASVHVGDVSGQVAETFENLAALLRAATGSDSADLRQFRDVRVYHVRAGDAETLRPLCQAGFPNATLEFVYADLCRNDLLVEIEGVASAGTMKG